ncbi:hypothetical protein LUR56_17080 [Streptomyces sp. MT29]|nr:hypothetical protein [Streptomyces sp. MT29]
MTQQSVDGVADEAAYGVAAAHDERGDAAGEFVDPEPALLRLGRDQGGGQVVGGIPSLLLHEFGGVLTGAGEGVLHAGAAPAAG